MKKLLFIFIYMYASLFAGEITIAVAANVSYVMEDLVQTFNKSNPDVKVNVVFGSSGKLTSQIRQGAPYDIFMSANMAYPQALYDEGNAISDSMIYAYGTLAFLSNKKRNPCKEETVLDDEDIKKIAIANPKTAPYGLAAVEALKNAKQYEKHKDKFVYGESVSQTVFYATVAADIGIVATSALHSPNLTQFREGIHWWEVDEELYTPIAQGIVMLEKDEEVKTFYDFILSVEAQSIFEKYGYKLPPIVKNDGI